MKEILNQYIELINKNYSTHETTEHSFRGEFKMLCESSLNDEKTNDLMTDIDTHIVL